MTSRPDRLSSKDLIRRSLHAAIRLVTLEGNHQEHEDKAVENIFNDCIAELMAENERLRAALEHYRRADDGVCKMLAGFSATPEMRDPNSVAGKVLDWDSSKKPVDAYSSNHLQTPRLIPYQLSLLSGLNETHAFTTSEIAKSSVPDHGKVKYTGWLVRSWLVDLESIGLVERFKHQKQVRWRRTMAGTVAIQPNKHSGGDK